jgi:hypothetical protein
VKAELFETSRYPEVDETLNANGHREVVGVKTVSAV